MQSILEIIRGIAHQHIDTLSLEQLVRLLPKSLVEGDISKSSKSDEKSPIRQSRRKMSSDNTSLKPARRVLKRIDHSITMDSPEAEKIWAKLHNLTPGSRAYKEASRELSRKLRVTRRQIGAVISTYKVGNPMKKEALRRVTSDDRRIIIRDSAPLRGNSGALHKLFGELALKLSLSVGQVRGVYSQSVRRGGITGQSGAPMAASTHM